MVGAERFELSTFCSQGRRASQAALYPDLSLNKIAIISVIAREGTKKKA